MRQHKRKGVVLQEKLGVIQDPITHVQNNSRHIGPTFLTHVHA